MAKVGLRRLVVEDRPFLWRRTHRHAETGPRRCEEILRVFAEGNKKSVLQITFSERPGWQVGYPEDGVVWSTADSRSYNLNRPAVVGSLISFMLRSGWDPDGSGAALEIVDGISLLASSGGPLGVA